LGAKVNPRAFRGVAVWDARVWMRRTVTRTVAVGAFGAGIAAGVAVVVDAVGSRPPPAGGVAAAVAAQATHTVRFGRTSVDRTARPDGSVCFVVRRGSFRRQSCFRRAGPQTIGYLVARRSTGQIVVGGFAGAQVRGVRVRLRPQGSIAAPLRFGTFFVAVPPGRAPSAVVKVLRSGGTLAFPVLLRSIR
jgi:hypothetical protein